MSISLKAQLPWKICQPDLVEIVDNKTLPPILKALLTFCFIRGN